MEINPDLILDIKIDKELFIYDLETVFDPLTFKITAVTAQYVIIGDVLDADDLAK